MKNVERNRKSYIGSNNNLTGIKRCQFCNVTGKSITSSACQIHIMGTLYIPVVTNQDARSFLGSDERRRILNFIRLRNPLRCDQSICRE